MQNLSIDCLHIVLNSVTHDSRVLKATKSALASGMVRRLEIAGLRDHGDNIFDTLSDGRTIRRFDLTSRQWSKSWMVRSLKYIECYNRMIGLYRKEPLRLIHAHDLPTLPIGIRLARLTGAKLVYDSHELQSHKMRDGSERAKRNYQKLIWGLERRLLAGPDAMITVSPSILTWYEERCPSIPVHLIRNVPERPAIMPEAIRLRAQLGVPGDSLLFLYLGGIGPRRGVENVLNSFLVEDIKHHILFLGSGVLEEVVKAAAARCPRIHLRPPVPPSEVLAHALGADIGICLYEDSCLNHRYCLPNKLFESLLAGLPVLASNLPDQARVVEMYNAGWVLDNTLQELTDHLRTLTVDEARSVRAELPERVAALSWENETKALFLIYKKLLQSGTPRL